MPLIADVLVVSLSSQENGEKDAARGLGRVQRARSPRFILHATFARVDKREEKEKKEEGERNLKEKKRVKKL